MNTNKLVKIGMVAAIYVVLTLSLPSLGYGPIQFRISEILVLLAFIDPIYIVAITLGCAIANFSSPLGIIDVFVGSFNSFVSLYMISKSKNLYIASIWPAIFSFIVGFEIYILSKEPINFFLITAQITLSEFIIVSLIAVPIFKVLMKNKILMSLLKNDVNMQNMMN